MILWDALERLVFRRGGRFTGCWKLDVLKGKFSFLLTGCFVPVVTVVLVTTSDL